MLTFLGAFSIGSADGMQEREFPPVGASKAKSVSALSGVL